MHLHDSGVGPFPVERLPCRMLNVPQAQAHPLLPQLWVHAGLASTCTCTLQSYQTYMQDFSIARFTGVAQWTQVEGQPTRTWPRLICAEAPKSWRQQLM